MKLGSISKFLRIGTITDKKIVQYSLPRTGSTLIWNILKLYSENPLKVHSKSELEHPLKKYRFIVSMRNPLDITCSIISVLNLSFNEHGLNQAINKIKSHNFNHLIEILENQDSLCLKYEEFYNNYDFAFENIDCFLNQKISNEKKIHFKNEFSLSKVRKISQSQKSFGQYDSVTKIHGNHLSKMNGKIDSYQDYLSEEMICFLRSELKEYIQYFNY